MERCSKLIHTSTFIPPSWGKQSMVICKYSACFNLQDNTDAGVHIMESNKSVEQFVMSKHVGFNLMNIINAVEHFDRLCASFRGKNNKTKWKTSRKRKENDKNKHYHLKSSLCAVIQKTK
ncbi:hypothetical protein PanWU01x14_207890 [Parasponia andersonii]|uniref:Uncharacterized protein n=1 Tax=Parasponia andersonii TaxID=3476 RepID=A0A2P5BV75_PARAD|nr:hypothetical protein PanWU01x14_207890 [Parasponia andersonii]